MGLGMVLKAGFVALNPGYGLVAAPQDMQGFSHHGTMVEVTVDRITGAMQDFKDIVCQPRYTPFRYSLAGSMVPVTAMPLLSRCHSLGQNHAGAQ